jgi:hypothetical protein
VIISLGYVMDSSIMAIMSIMATKYKGHYILS